MDRIKALYELYNGAVYRYFLRMTGNSEAAGELTQEVFFQACLSLHRFKQEASLKTWLFAIARNVYLKHLRQKSQEPAMAWEENYALRRDPSQEDINPAEKLISDEERARVQNALSRLPENIRTLIVLKEYEQLSYREIAGIFGQTENWARVNFFRAKKQLGQVYRELEGEQ